MLNETVSSCSSFSVHKYMYMVHIYIICPAKRFLLDDICMKIFSSSYISFIVSCADSIFVMYYVHRHYS